MLIHRLLGTSILALLFASPLFAAKLKTWNAQGQSAYTNARFENAVISNEGAIRLAHALTPVAAGKIDAAQVWDLIEDREGSLLIATGGEGKILKLSANGDLSTLAENKAGPFFSLALAPDGGVYAGTGPDGRIVHVSPKGEVKTVCETGENYVWALVVVPDTKTLFAATGPKGRILQITPEGKVSTLLQTKQEHVLCLAADTNGILYAGTDKQGLIYRIDQKGKAFVLYQASQGEVRSLLVTPEAVYAGTAAPTKKRGTTTATTASFTKEASTTAPVAPSVGENSVYRIAADGSVREIFRDKSQMLCLAKTNGKLLVGTGMDGRLFEVDETSRDFTEIARPDVGQIMRMLRRADGSVIFGTADTGQVFTLQNTVAASGTVLSEVFDAKLVSKWGAFTWRADVPNGTTLTVAVRGGNTSEPDDTWTDWSAENHNPATALFNQPACRFAQFRLSMKSRDGKNSPTVHAVSLRYATANQAPEVTALEIPDLEAAPQKEPKKVKLKWTATDANEDDLTYDLWVRKEGWTDWVRIEDAFAKSEYEWDTTTIPSGLYRVKVVASDRTDNADETSLTGSREAGPVLVAHEPPNVAIKLLKIEDGKALFEATATAPLARLASASYAINGKRWENVFPTDGLFDGRDKTFRFQTEAIGSSANVLVIRVKDVAANTGTADVVFTIPKK